MAKKKKEEDERRLSVDEQRAQDEADGEADDGRIILTNDSGEIKKVAPEEWENEERQAELLRDGWKEMGLDQVD
jgi:hypothetical protein